MKQDFQEKIVNPKYKKVSENERMTHNPRQGTKGYTNRSYVFFFLFQEAVKLGVHRIQNLR